LVTLVTIKQVTMAIPLSPDHGCTSRLPPAPSEGRGSSPGSEGSERGPGLSRADSRILLPEDPRPLGEDDFRPWRLRSMASASPVCRARTERANHVVKKWRRS